MDSETGTWPIGTLLTVRSEELPTKYIVVGNSSARTSEGAKMKRVSVKKANSNSRAVSIQMQYASRFFNVERIPADHNDAIIMILEYA